MDIKKHTKRCLSPFVISEMQIKTKMRYYYTPREWLKLKGPIIPKVGEDVEELEFSYIADGNVKWDNHFRKQVQQFLKRSDTHLSYD